MGGRSDPLYVGRRNRNNSHPLASIQYQATIILFSLAWQPPARQMSALVSAISSHSGQRPLLGNRYHRGEPIK